MENALPQLGWRQWTRCCPFLSAVGIKLRTLPCIDLLCSLCLGGARFDKFFASPTSFISKAVLVWLNTSPVFIVPSDGKWTRDILIEWLGRFTNELEENNQWLALAEYLQLVRTAQVVVSYHYINPVFWLPGRTNIKISTTFLEVCNNNSNNRDYF